MTKLQTTDVTYGEGGDYMEDDDLWSDVKATDQAAAEFLQVLDEIEPRALNRVKMLVPLLPNRFVLFAHDRELAWLLAHDLETRTSSSTKAPDYQNARSYALLSKYEDYLYELDHHLRSKYDELMGDLAEEILSTLANWICTFHLWSRPVVQLVILTLSDWKRLELKNEAPKGGRWGQRVDFYADPKRNQKDEILRFYSYGAMPSLSVNYDLEFRMEQAWDPFQETWSSAGPRIRKAFKETLNQYRLQVIEAAKVQDGRKVRHKRSSREHFQWLVYYQVLGMSHEGVVEQNASGARNDRSTIIEGIESAANLLELILRTPTRRRGRPRGRKDSKPRKRDS
jgi:hypothetical protein